MFFLNVVVGGGTLAGVVEGGGGSSVPCTPIGPFVEVKHLNHAQGYREAYSVLYVRREKATKRNTNSIMLTRKKAKSN